MPKMFQLLEIFIEQEGNRRNLRFLRRFFFFMLALLALYSVLFHVIMVTEGRDHSWITGLYWSLTVMTTLGFGDITFTSDLGKFFTILVTISGSLLFMLILPFIFIRFIYIPWLDAQTKAATPRSLPKEQKNHTVLIGTDAIALSIGARLKRYSLPYTFLEDQPEKASALHELGTPVVLGELDDVHTYQALQVPNAALVVALHDDFRNTNIASTVREVSADVPIAASVNTITAADVLAKAECDHVFNFVHLLGKSLARRVFDLNMQSNTIARFENLCIAEAPAIYVDFSGKTVAEADLRSRYGLNLLGIWHGREYVSVKPDTVIAAEDVMLLAGTADKLENYDRKNVQQTKEVQHPAIILGAGRVGRAIALALEERGIDFRLVDKNSDVPSAKDPRFIKGDASDHEVLLKAGIANAPTVLVTTHNDDLNIYLTLYCHKLRPDVQLISRATLDKNISSLYKAGASLVMSQASITASTIVNLLQPEQVFMLTEGLSVFRQSVGSCLAGKNLIQSGIRVETGCNVVAVKYGDTMNIPPDPARPLASGDELVLIGTEQEEERFRIRYGCKPAPAPRKWQGRFC